MEVPYPPPQRSLKTIFLEVHKTFRFGSKTRILGMFQQFHKTNTLTMIIPLPWNYKSHDN